MKIGEIANKTNLPASTLRYYEKRGLLKVDRDKNGRRYYKESDIEWIKFIRRLKETGMLIKDIQQLKWTEYLQNLDDKIEFYQQSIKNMTKHNL